MSTNSSGSTQIQSILKSDLKLWFVTHNMTCEWLSDSSFKLANQVFTILAHKQGFIFNAQYSLLIDEKECEEAERVEADNWCFCFGDNWYYCNCDNSFTPTCKDLLELGQCIETKNDKLSYLGIHSSYELGNGTRTFDRWCKTAKFLQYKSIGICDKNTLAGVMAFQQQCEKFDLKPIIGMSTMFDFFSCIGEVKLYAVDNCGWSNLLQINKIINVDNQRHILPEQWMELGLGVICVISKSCTLTEEIVELCKVTFFRTYYQIDPTPFTNQDRDDKTVSNLELYIQQFSEQIPIALICDTYYLYRSDSHIKKTINQTHGLNEPDSQSQYFKTIEQIWSEYVELVEVIDQSKASKLFQRAVKGANDISRWCHFKVDASSVHLPEYIMTGKEIELYSTRKDMFESLIQQGLVRIEKQHNEKYTKRASYELEVIINGGFVDYFLILWDVIRHCKEVNILSGIGRGSAGGSLIAYLLEITKLDPLQYDLLFERFLNEGRLGKKIKADQVILDTEKMGKIVLWHDDICTITRQNQIIQVLASELLESDDLISF